MLNRKPRKRLIALIAVLFLVIGSALALTHSARAATPPVAPAVAAAPPGSTFTADNLTGIHTKPLAYTNGLCMYVNSAAAGQPVRLGNCSNTNQWSYYSSGQLSPEGHPEVGVADSGGNPVLKSEPTTVIDSDAVINGTLGQYFELLMTGKIGSHPHNYLHNNGNGNPIGGDSEMGNLANYYRMAPD